MEPFLGAQATTICSLVQVGCYRDESFSRDTRAALTRPWQLFRCLVLGSASCRRAEELINQLSITLPGPQGKDLKARRRVLQLTLSPCASPCPAQAEPCLGTESHADMSEQSHVNSLFLNEDAAKRLSAEGRVQRLRQAVQKRAARAKKRMHSITADSAKSFFRRNAFVLFTIVAVLLGTELAATPGTTYKCGEEFVYSTKVLFIITVWLGR